MAINHTIMCPNCNKKIHVKYIENISNLDISLIEKLEFIKYKCVHCNQLITLSYPFFYENNNYLLTYQMDKINENKITRHTSSINDFKEKFLILNDNLNDILIELIKEYIKKQTGIDGEIRYEGITDDSILFYLFSTKQDVKISKVFYNDLLNRSKFKKLKKHYEINSLNYLDFIRLK